MATESQMDLWRRNIRSNLNKAGKAARDAGENDEISPQDKLRIALAAAQITSQTMIAERLGQILLALYSEDEVLEAAQERVRTAEQIMQRFADTFDIDKMESPEESLVINVTMMEDWLDPESLVNFASPEAVESGSDQQTRELEKEDKKT